MADTQALTDNAHAPDKVRLNVMEVALDYLAVGIDPAKTTICLQSHLPALAELSMPYLNFVTVARLERNPTIKDEIRGQSTDARRAARQARSKELVDKLHVWLNQQLGRVSRNSTIRSG